MLRPLNRLWLHGVTLSLWEVVEHLFPDDTGLQSEFHDKQPGNVSLFPWFCRFSKTMLPKERVDLCLPDAAALTLSVQRGALSSVLPRGDADDSFERFVEGAIGIIPHHVCYRHLIFFTLSHQITCLIHAPACDILHRTFTDQLLEAKRKRRTRQANGCSQRFNRPWIFHVLVHCSENCAN